jgi:low temperature requirement protein LtrA
VRAFDLVYVFAIGELAHHLLADVDVRTGAETVILALAVVYAWFMTAWGMNWLDPDTVPVRLLVVGLMFASLLMSASIADAFDDRAWLFVTSYLLLQVGRSTFLIVALRGRALSAHFVNDLVWELSTGAVWIAGAVAHGDARLVLWGLAVTATQASVWSLHWLPSRGRAVDIAHTEISAAHLFERFRLFFIIALGELVLATGNAFVAEPFELERLAALAIAFTGTVALWWCYFYRAEVIAAEAVDDADDAGAVGLARHLDADVDRACPDRHRRRRRARDRPPGARPDAWLRTADLRRPGALPARPNVVHGPDDRIHIGLARRRARRPRVRHRSHEPHRRHRRVERCACGCRGRRHAPT